MEERLLCPGKLSWIIVYIINVENEAAEISKGMEEMWLYSGKQGWITVYLVNVENVAAEIRKDYGRSVSVPWKAGLDNCLYGKCRECCCRDKEGLWKKCVCTLESRVG